VVVASAEVNGADVAFGDKLPVSFLSAGSSDALQIQVQVQHAHDKTPVTAHQAVLKFTHAEEKTSTYFVLPADKSAKTHGAVLHFGALSSKFAYQSGVHNVELIVGDPTFERAVVWDLGRVDLELAAAPPVQPSPLYAKPLLHESDTTLKALPEIAHVMRPQDPRPPVAVSLAFTAAVLAPLAAFLLFALKLQLNVGKLFQPSVLPFGVVFLASLGAIFALFGWYWLELTMFRTLGYLSGLSTVTLWSGHLTLKRLAQQSSGKKSKTE
jgi:oligosaccharyltransferase complex subunit delta (ribophorin II)